MKDSSLKKSPAGRGGALPVTLFFLMAAVVGVTVTLGSEETYCRQYFTDESAGRLPGHTEASNRILLEDVDADGDLDLLISNTGFPGALNRLLVNNGEGRFEDETMDRMPLLIDQTYSIAAGDLDLDSDIDLLISNLSGGNRLLVNDGGGVFRDESDVRLPGGYISRVICLGDIDADGDVDMILLGLLDASLLVNDGSGCYTDQTDLRLPAVSPEARAGLLEDMDRDGDLDLVVGFEGDPGVVLENDGSGFFSEACILPASQDTMKTRGFWAADMDADGGLDLVEAAFTRGLFGDRVLVAEGNHLEFTDKTGSLFPQLPYHMDEGNSPVVADFDMDGRPEVFIAKYEQSLFLAKGESNQFVDVTSERLPEDISTLSTWADCGDVDGDGDPDLVISNLLQRNNIYINHSVPDTTEPTISVVIRPEGIVLPGEEQDIRIIVADGALSIASVELVFSNDGKTYHKVSCRHLGGSLYRGEIPGQGAGSTVYFYAVASDARNNTSTDPESAPDSMYFFRVEGPTGTGESDRLSHVPGETALLQNYPNPFNPCTLISFTVGEDDVGCDRSACVTLAVFDARGRKQSDVFSGTLPPGRYTFTWSGRSGSGGGVYLIHLDVGGRVFVTKAVLLP